MSAVTGRDIVAFVHRLGVGVVVVAGRPAGAGVLTALTPDGREVLKGAVVHEAWQEIRHRLRLSQPHSVLHLDERPYSGQIIGLDEGDLRIHRVDVGLFLGSWRPLSETPVLQVISR